MNLITRPIGIFLASLLAGLLSACATPPPPRGLPLKLTLESPYTVARSGVLDVTSNVLMHADAKRQVMYQQSNGGGGAAVGLLLGPLGVMANASMIEAVTKADVARLKDRLGLDPEELFREIAGPLPVSSPVDPSKLRVTPYILVKKTRADRLLVSSALLIEKQQGAEQWSGRLMYQLPQSYTLDELASLDATGLQRLQNDARDGFRQLFQHASREGQGRLPPARPVKFRSEFFDAAFDMEYAGDLLQDAADILWIRTAGSVYAVRKANISLTQ